MNREQRRRLKKEERRNPNSKKNWGIGGIREVPIDQIQHNDNLKECDSELLDLICKSYDWKIKNKVAKQIIGEALGYLDSLCSLRFEITPIDDRRMVRDTMHFISDFVNMFIGLYYEHDKEKTLSKLKNEALEEGMSMFALNIPVHKEIAPIYGDVLTLPSSECVNNMYAYFVVEHANKLADVLLNAKYSDVLGDEVEIFEVLLFISKKTLRLMPEASAA